MQCAPLIFEYTYASTRYTTCVSTVPIESTRVIRCRSFEYWRAVYTPISIEVRGVVGWAGNWAEGVDTEGCRGTRYRLGLGCLPVPLLLRFFFGLGGTMPVHRYRSRDRYR